MKIVKYFNKKSFDNNWHHHHDASCLIIGKELSREQLNQIKLKNFDFVDFEKNIFHTIAKRIQKNEYFALSSNSAYILDSDCDLSCYTQSFDILDLTMSLKNLPLRAKAVFHMQKNVLDKYGTFFSNGSMTGSWCFWNNFTCFRDHLLATNQLEIRDFYEEFILNFFISLNSNLTVKGLEA